MTPRLSDHARQRCREMGVSTKRVKQIVRDPHVDYDSRWGLRMASRTDEPDIRALYAFAGGERLVVTVVWRKEELYAKAEAS